MFTCKKCGTTMYKIRSESWVYYCPKCNKEYNGKIKLVDDSLEFETKKDTARRVLSRTTKRIAIGCGILGAVIGGIIGLHLAFNIFQSLAISTIEEDKLAYETHLAVNKVRVENELPELQWNPEIAKVAKTYSEKLIAIGKVEHGDFQSRIKNVCPNLAAGENLFSFSGGYPINGAQEAVDGWMNSLKGHRENVLSTSFKQQGIGVATNGVTVVWVQDLCG